MPPTMKQHSPVSNSNAQYVNAIGALSERMHGRYVMQCKNAVGLQTTSTATRNPFPHRKAILLVQMGTAGLRSRNRFGFLAVGAVGFGFVIVPDIVAARAQQRT